MEPTNNEIHNSVQGEETLNEAEMVPPTTESNFSESVINEQLEEVKQENFFDKNITFITFLFCILFFPFSVIISLLLGAYNFRNKRNEISRGIQYFFLVLLILGLVGFGLFLFIAFNLTN